MTCVSRAGESIGTGGVRFVHGGIFATKSQLGATMTSLRSWFVSGPCSLPLSPFVLRPLASVNFGFQAGSGDISQSLQPIIYDEAAKVDVSQTYENGPLVDVGGSYMLFGKWGVGVSYNHTSGDGNATIAAQIPDPKGFDNPRAVSLSASGLKHSEDAVHVDVLYRFAATPKIDVTVGGGPTFFAMKQEFVTELAVTETSPPPGPYNPGRHTDDHGREEIAGGFNIGADVTYMLTPSMGVGCCSDSRMRTLAGRANTPTPIGVRAAASRSAAGSAIAFRSLVRGVQGWTRSSTDRGHRGGRPRWPAATRIRALQRRHQRPAPPVTSSGLRPTVDPESAGAHADRSANGAGPPTSTSS
jgi:hypothetical protein